MASPSLAISLPSNPSVPNPTLPTTPEKLRRLCVAAGLALWLAEISVRPDDADIAANIYDNAQKSARRCGYRLALRGESGNCFFVAVRVEAEPDSEFLRRVR